MTSIIVKISIEGLHAWFDCPIEEVNYLKTLHRHNFFITCLKEVTHSDRDIEIIQFKHNIKEYLDNKYWDNNYRCLVFGGMSCEMIAEELGKKFDLESCMVLEDNEVGGIWSNDKIKVTLTSEIFGK